MSDENKTRLRPALLGSMAAISVLSLIYLLRASPVFNFEGGDNANYLLLAKALASGHGYRDLFIPGAPLQTQYPPLFPAMLALIIEIRGMDIHLMNFLVQIGASVTFFLTYVLLKRKSFSFPGISVIWLACSYNFFTQSDWLLTETVFTAFSIASILCFDKWIEKKSLIYFFIAALTCWAAAMTRTAGMALIAAFVIVIFIRHRNSKYLLKAIGIGAIFSAPLLLWFARNFIMLGSTTDYSSQFMMADPYNAYKGEAGLASFAHRVIENVQNHGADLASIIMPDAIDLSRLIVIVIAALLLIIILYGFYVRTKDGPEIIEIYSVIYTCMILLWPFRGYRFMMPIYPFIYAYLAEGLYNLFIKASGAKNFVGSVKRIFAASLILASIILNVRFSFIYQTTLLGRIKNGEYHEINGIKFMALWDNHQRLLNACIWLYQNADPNSIVLTRLGRLTALASMRKVVVYPSIFPADLREFIIKNKINYILLDEIYPNSYQFFDALTSGAMNVNGLEIVYADGNTAVVEVKPEF